MDKQLLLRVLRHLKEDPKLWNQARWESCFAGHTLRLVGFREFTDASCACTYDCDVIVDGEPRPVKEVAAEYLGIDTDQADILFRGDNTIYALERMVNQLVHGVELVA